MTKAEELKVLEKIDALIKSTGEDSYIAMTFAGIVDVARTNIENDWGEAPVEDLAAAREKIRKMEVIAKLHSEQYDGLMENYKKLSELYRFAAQTIRAAQCYVHAERVRLMNELDALSKNVSDEDITYAFRQHKQAQIAERRCAEVLDAYPRSPAYNEC